MVGVPSFSCIHLISKENLEPLPYSDSNFIPEFPNFYASKLLIVNPNPTP